MSTCTTNCTSETVLDELYASVSPAYIELTTRDAASHLDATDPIPSLRSEFHIPTYTSSNTIDKSLGVVYLCGNSLGLQPKHTAHLINEELQVWADRGVMGHFDHPYHRSWVSIDDTVNQELTRIVGAHSVDEIAVMGSLTNNLHLLMVSFYRPTPTRFKILIEAKAFPSDTYAITSQVAFHGFDPKEGVIELSPRQGEHTLRTQDIEQVLTQYGNEIALCMLSGVQYYTGQLFDIPRITRIAHDHGCIVGWDLAHAIGNVPLYLHDWNVDFAAWCSYKYLNSGPGGIAGIFVHDKHARDINYSPKFVGWWGHNKKTRFNMPQQFEAIPGAQGFQLSNPNIIATVALLGSMKVFAKTSMQDLRKRSLRLTFYLEYLIDNVVMPLGPAITQGLEIITPRDPMQRGAQLSLLFANILTVAPLMQLLEQNGIVVDERKPNVIRVAPAPLYNSFTDVRRFVDVLVESLHVLVKTSAAA